MFNGPVWFFLPFGLLFVGSFVVWIWALVDAIQVPDDSMYRSGTKLVWVLVILLTQVVGAIIYFAIGRPSRRTAPAIPPPLPRFPPPAELPPGGTQSPWGGPTLGVRKEGEDP